MTEAMTRFTGLRDQWWPRMRSRIDDVVATSVPRESLLIEMLDYHLQTGGKRLRALLPIEVATALGTPPEHVIAFGAACELLHNATLVHDDLQDGDPVRRGQPTVWSRYGAAQAINLGDAMFQWTLLLAQRLDTDTHRRAEVTERMIRETLRVISGQTLEFRLQETPNLTMSHYVDTVEGKTSGLFALPMAGAALACGADAPIVSSLTEAARHLGMLFQIQDDVLDLYADKGRETRGNDIREGKRSILIVHALHHATPNEARWLRAVLDRPRAETTVKQVTKTMALLEDLGSLDYALCEINRLRTTATSDPIIASHPTLSELMQRTCEVCLHPVAHLLTRSAPPLSDTA